MDAGVVEAVKDVLLGALGRLNEIGNPLQLAAFALVLLVVVVLVLTLILRKQQGTVRILIIFVMIGFLIVISSASAAAVIATVGAKQARDLGRELEETPGAEAILQPLEPEEEGAAREGPGPPIPAEISRRLEELAAKVDFYATTKVAAYSDVATFAGRDAFLHGDVQKAKELFTTATSLEATPARWNDLGVTALTAGDLELAQGYFESASERDPQYPNAYNGLGLVALERAKRAPTADGAALDEAERLFDRAIELKSDYGKAFNNRGLVHLERAKIEGSPEQSARLRQQALRDFERAHELLPKEAVVTGNIGLAHELLQQRDQAARFYENALEQNPKLPMALNNLAMLHLQDGEEVAEALELAQRAVASKPGDPGYQDTLARALEAAGRKREALELAEEALAAAREQSKSYVPEISKLVERLRREVPPG